MNSTHYELEALVLSIPDKLVDLGMIDSEDEYALFYSLRYKIEEIKKGKVKLQLTLLQRVTNKLKGLFIAR
jgi:hypothetical protein